VHPMLNGVSREKQKRKISFFLFFPANRFLIHQKNILPYITESFTPPLIFTPPDRDLTLLALLVLLFHFFLTPFFKKLSLYTVIVYMKLCNGSHNGPVPINSKRDSIRCSSRRDHHQKICMQIMQTSHQVNLAASRNSM